MNELPATYDDGRPVHFEVKPIDELAAKSKALTDALAELKLVKRDRDNILQLLSEERNARSHDSVMMWDANERLKKRGNTYRSRALILSVKARRWKKVAYIIHADRHESDKGHRRTVETCIELFKAFGAFISERERLREALKKLVSGHLVIPMEPCGIFFGNECTCGATGMNAIIDVALWGEKDGVKYG